MNHSTRKEGNNNQGTRIVLFIVLLVLGVSCSILLLVFSIPGFLGSFSISSDTGYYFSGKYTEYSQGEKAYSCLPSPEDLGDFNNIVFRFWKHSKDDYESDNTFFLDLDYEKSEFERILPTILAKYDLLNKNKYYYYYAAEDEKDKYNKEFKDNQYSFIDQNEFLSFNNYYVNNGDTFTVGVNMAKNRIRFIYNTGSKISVIRLNRNRDVWGETYDSETSERMKEEFWEKYPPI